MKSLTDFMTDTIKYGIENRRAEFKPPIGWYKIKKPRQSEITKAALAISNIPGGGHIFIGISQKRNRSKGTVFERKGLNNRQYKSFDKLDDIATFFNERSNRSIKFDIYGGEVKIKSSKRKFVVIRVFESKNFIPIICTRDYKPRYRHCWLSKGTIYIRSISDPPKSRGISSQEEWEEMIRRLLTYKEESLYKDLMAVCHHMRRAKKVKKLKKKMTSRAKNQYDKDLKRDKLR